MAINTLKDKLEITGKITLLTGMHIGASSDFAPIGAVDSVVVRDPLTKLPIIPGSSIKGKLRTMLAKTETDGPVLKEHSQDSDEIKRLFGCSVKPIIQSRLQFYDMKMSNKPEFENKTDLFLTEIKFENNINRTNAVANPRQIERVPAGAEFGLKIIYNLENLEAKTEEDSEKDFKNLALALRILELDYIGGSGTRGYGKVEFSGLKVTAKLKPNDTDIQNLQEILADFRTSESEE